jgi:hypothetical protein
MDGHARVQGHYFMQGVFYREGFGRQCARSAIDSAGRIERNLLI